MKYYIGIDLGGTNIAAGVVDESCKIIARASTPTKRPRSCADISEDMALRKVGASSPPNCASMAVVSESIDTSAATKFTAFVAERTGLLCRRVLTTFTEAVMIA